MLQAVKFKNHDDNRRVWLNIQREDGRTLELDAGETVELELPKGFKDPHLRPVGAKKSDAKNVVEPPVDPAPIDHEEKLP